MVGMGETAFDQLLAAARAQPEPQVLLFVFASAALPVNATTEQRASFESGVGGELAPSMCVGKVPDELSTFDALVEESRSAGPPWRVVFIAGLAGAKGTAPTPDVVEATLQTMVERVRNGVVDGFLALSVKGEALQFA